MTENRKKHLKQRLQDSRARLLTKNSNYTNILKDLIYVSTEKIKRISTNGYCIYFNPNWLQKLEDNSLDFILIHTVMHIHFDHINRPKYYKGKRYHLAVDIIVNSFLKDKGFDYKSLPMLGKIFTQTFYPVYEGKNITPLEAFSATPLDPDKMPQTKSRNYMLDEECFWDVKKDRGECGEIILSPKDNVSLDAHYTIKERAKVGLRKIFPNELKQREPIEVLSGEKEEAPDMPNENPWDNEVTYDIQNLRKYKNETKTTGQSEEFIERIWKRIPHNSLDWRKLINFFLTDEFQDYSFSPPDRRFDDDLFLPDFNVKDELPKDVLFFVDTSASINDETLSMVYAEIYGCLNQFDGKLKGLLAFFDTKVSRPIAFESIEDIQGIIPKGGGGTNFYSIFNFLKKEYGNIAPSNIVIFTDGESEYPRYQDTLGIPVLWLYTNENAIAPWGRSAVINNT